MTWKRALEPARTGDEARGVDEPLEGVEHVRRVDPAGAHAALARVDLALRSPFSGRVYRVGPDTRQIDADARDVAALLRTGQFSVGDVTLDIITLCHRLVS